MTVDLRRPRRAWLVIFEDEPTWMRIVAIEPAPSDPDTYAEVDSERDAACLSVFRVDAVSRAEARRCARQLHDVVRIQDVFARRRIRDQAHRRQAALGFHDATHAQQLLNRVAMDFALTPAAADRATAIVRRAMRAAYRYRPLNTQHLGFEQFVASLTGHAAATIHRHAAFVATGRNDEAVAALVLGLNGVPEGLR